MPRRSQNAQTASHTDLQLSNPMRWVHQPPCSLSGWETHCCFTNASKCHFRTNNFKTKVAREHTPDPPTPSPMHIKKQTAAYGAYLGINVSSGDKALQGVGLSWSGAKMEPIRLRCWQDAGIEGQTVAIGEFKRFVWLKRHRVTLGNRLLCK